jgi:hypothetical protein
MLNAKMLALVRGLGFVKMRTTVIAIAATTMIT